MPMAYIETNTLKQGLILFGTICDPNGRPFPLYHVQSHLPCKPFNAPRIWLRCDVFLPYWRCVFFTSCYSETFDLWEILYVRVFPSLILLVISWNFGIGKTVQLLVIPLKMNMLNPKMQVLFRWISFLYRFSGFQPLILQFFAAESAIGGSPSGW